MNLIGSLVECVICRNPLIIETEEENREWAHQTCMDKE